MKLRIFENSMRFRLTQKETQDLFAGHPLTMTLKLGPIPKDWTEYELTQNSCTSMNASMDKNSQSNKIKITIPSEQIAKWRMNDQQIGIEDICFADQDYPVKIIIEKDFRCLKPRPGKDDHDTFPHPSKKGSHP